MADKSWRASAFKRTIDLGTVSTAELYDLVRFWRVDTGDEKAISVQNLIGSFVVGGIVPSTRTLTINGVTYDLSADRSWTVGNISGTIDSGQVAFGTAANTIGGGARLLFSNSANAFLDIYRDAVSNGARLRFYTTGVTQPWDIGLLGTISDIVIQYNGSVFQRITTTGNTMIGSSSNPTNTLDVNGTARIRSVANATGNFATYSATGVLQQRTAAETLVDIGGIGGSIASGQVAFGTAANTIGGSTGFTWDNVTGTLTISSRLDISSGRDSYLTSSNSPSIYRSTINVSPSYPFASAGNLVLQGRSSANTDIVFVTGLTPSWKWSINSGGLLESNGSQTIRTTTGNLNLATGGGNGNINITPNGTGNIGLGLTAPTTFVHIRKDSLYNSEPNTSLGIDSGGANGSAKLLIGVDTTNDISYIQSMQQGTGWTKNLVLQGMGGNVLIGSFSGGMPTSKLDINGDLRVRSVANATGNFATYSATGVLQQRTAAETLVDIGAIGGTIASGQVAFGTGVNTIGGSSNFTWDNVTGELRINNKINLGDGYEANLSSPEINISGTASNVSLNVSSSRAGFFYADSARTILGEFRNLPLYFRTNNADRVTILGTGLVGIATTSPTDTLDVNGTARIRSVANATGNFATYSATGVLQQRTAAETLVDIGAIGGTIASGQVAFGTGVNTIGGDSGLTWDNTSKFLTITRTAAGSLANQLSLVNNSSSANTESSLRFAPSTAFTIRYAEISGYNDGSNNIGIKFITGTGATITEKWRILPNGTLQALGAQTINTSTGNLTLQTGGGLGNIFLMPNGAQVGINTTSPTNTLDVNGTARIRSVANATGNFATYSATGVLQQRTAAETLVDIGAIGGSIASGQVAFGTAANTIGGNADLVWNNSAKFLSINGKLTVGTLVQPDTINIYSLGNLSGGTSVIGVLSQNQIQSGVTDTAVIFRSSPSTQAATFTLSQVTHFLAQPSTFGAGSTVTSQNGFFVASNLTGATNNFAFRSVLNSGTGRWNLYMDGTATNYLAGSLWIATTSGTNTLDVNGTARIRSVANATGNFATYSATGVLQQRTAAEVVTDLGIVNSKWTDLGSDIYRNSRVLIGSTAFSDSGAKLEIVQANADYVNGLTITNTQSWGYGSSINFKAFLASGDPSTGYAARILQGYEASGKYYLGFYTANFSTLTENLRLTSDGKLGISTTSPTEVLDVNGKARVRTIDNATGDFLTVSATGVVQKRTASEVAGDIGSVSASTGTFTPTLIDSSGGATYTLGTTYGDYYKIGKLVFINIRIVVTSTSGTPTGQLRLGNFPFNFDSSTGTEGSFNIGRFTNSDHTAIELYKLSCWINDGNNYVSINQIDSTTIAPSFTNGIIQVTGVYTTDS